jgi:hypothetical protein
MNFLFKEYRTVNFSSSRRILKIVSMKNEKDKFVLNNLNIYIHLMKFDYLLICLTCSRLIPDANK